MKKKYLKLLPVALNLAPFYAYAQQTQGGLSGAIGNLQTVVTLFIGFLFVLATAVFLWGIVVYLTAAGDESKIEGGRKYIIWGLIALFIMLAVWGIVQILVATFGITGTGIPATVI
jgi:heme/copper-type cytochrome/quinol oxidase subunit 2